MTPKHYIPAIQILNIAGLLGVITINVLANTLPINGLTAGEVSAQYENLFTPAGFTFSIWSVIYLGLVGFAIFQFWETKNNSNPEILSSAGAIGITFFISCLANIGWLISWHHQLFSLTLLLMSILLLSLIDINRRIHQISERYSSFKRANNVFIWSVKIPFGLYLGWICVATIANAAVYLKFSEWSAWGISEQSWATFMVVVGAMIGLWMLARFRSISAVVAVAWGILGIYLNIWKTENIALAGACIMMVLIILVGIARAIRRKQVLNDHYGH